MTEAGSPVDELVACLDLESLDRDLFLGDPGPGEGRLFGGMVAAQCAVSVLQASFDLVPEPGGGRLLGSRELEGPLSKHGGPLRSEDGLC